MLPIDPITIALFIIFASAMMMATLALYTRQSLLVAYIVLGIILGPQGLKVFTSTALITPVGNVGIIFLLFLVGLDLPPKNLLMMFQETMVVTLLSSLLFLIMSVLIAHFFGFHWLEAGIIGLAMMFSSTIIGLKLLPTTVLHHQHTGELMISILLMQDLLAILALLLVSIIQSGRLSVIHILQLSLCLPLMVLIIFGFAHYFLLVLMRRFNRIHEYIFLVSIAWCLAGAVLAMLLKLPAEIGAFLAGVSLATHPVSQFIADSLKPLRDFFLILFFFSVGAEYTPHALHSVIIPAVFLAAIILVIKPWLFRILLKLEGESSIVATEVGARLGQASEFSLLIASIAITPVFGASLIGDHAMTLIQTTTLITFMISSYWVVIRYPTPLAFNEKMRRN